MQDTFESLFAAILEDDRTKAKVLRDREPIVTQRTVVEESRYESQIAHWFYAGDTLLHVAAAGYRVEIASLLLATGADVSSARNRRSSQPLHYAADGYLDSPSWNASRQVAMINLLLEAGSQIDAQDKNGAAPLHRAVRTRCTDAVKCFLNAGADPMIRNKHGSTPFHLAVQNTGRGGSGTEKARTAQREILEAFLRRGVNPRLTVGNGKSVLDSARSEWIRRILGKPSPS